MKRHEEQGVPVILDRLADLLDDNDIASFPLESVHGFVTALVCAPEPIAATCTMPGLLGDEEEPFTPPTPEIAKEIDTILSDLSKEILTEITNDRYGIIVSPSETDDDAEDVTEWCIGFSQALMMHMGDLISEPDDELEEILLPILYIANPDAFVDHVDKSSLDELEKQMEDFAMDIGQRVYMAYDRWHKQKTVVVEATPGRNDDCTCGSGKKYKKCCGSES